MIKKYSFVTDKDKVFVLYKKVVGKIWPIEKEQFYDVLVHTPPPQSVASFISISNGKMNGFISTQIMNKRGSIVLTLFEPGHEYIGEKLLNKALEHFQQNGITNIQLGAGAYTSFWPGIPTNLPQLIAFFETHEWQFNEESVDMVRDIGNFAVPKEMYERISSNGVIIQSLKPEEIDKLLAFELSHFPRWERYFSETIKKNKLDEIVVAKNEKDEVVGSVLVGKRKVLWTGLLGKNVGTLGCLGVAQDMRGKGIGLALAARATEILKQQHVQVSYLSWTYLTDWYGKLGYQTWREYKMSWKELDPNADLRWKADKRKLKEIARKVIEIQFKETIIELKSIVDFGEVNYTLLVKTDKSSYVARLNAEDGVEKFQKEQWCIDLATQLEIPTPPIAYIGELEGVAVSIFPYIEGLNGSVHPNKTLIWECLGQYLRKIHQIKVRGYGEDLVNPDTHQFKDSWERYIQYNIDSLTPEDKLIEMGILNTQSSQLLQGIFTRLLNTSHTFGLSHGDVSEKNTIIDSQGGVWLTDWGSAEAQIIPHHDIFGILDWSADQDTPEFADFLKGYGMSRKEFNDIYPEILDYGLLQTIDKLRWAMDRKPEKIHYFADRLKKKLSERLT